MLKVKDVIKSYGEKEAKTTVLNKVSFELGKEEFCSIVGASGSGKSTLLNLIGSLDSADEGLILVDGKDILRLSKKERARYRRDYLGYVFQFYNLVPNLTVMENIRVCEELTDNPLNKEELVKELGLWEHKDKFPSQMSGGQQQRCAIARALIKNPKLLLCDEPTGALDSKNAKEIMTILKEVNQKYKTTVVIVTHNELICKMSDRIIGLSDGKIVKNEKVENPMLPGEIDWE